jgi:hypothetical protein
LWLDVCGHTAPPDRMNGGARGRLHAAAFANGGHRE